MIDTPACRHSGQVTRIVDGSPEEVRGQHRDGGTQSCPLQQFDSLASLRNGQAREDVATIEGAVEAQLL